MPWTEQKRNESVSFYTFNTANIKFNVANFKFNSSDMQHSMNWSEGTSPTASWVNVYEFEDIDETWGEE